MRHPTRPSIRRLVTAPVVVGGLLVLVAAGGSETVSAASTQTPTTTALPGIDAVLPAPSTTTSADGRTTTDGTRTLEVSEALDVSDPVTITVTGRGYDPFKGVYVAFCVLPQPNQRPTPCGGGADTEGTTGASAWFSSNPPPYGRGLAVAYGPDGSFQTTIAVTPVIAAGIDCRTVQCGIITRNDHIRSSDRSQDLFVPVRFAGTSPQLAPPTTTTAADGASSTTVVVTALPPAIDGTTTTTAPTAVAKADSGRGPAPLIAAGAAVVVAGVGGVVIVRRRRSRPGVPA
jgi:hypothetical protein